MQINVQNDIMHAKWEGGEIHKVPPCNPEYSSMLHLYKNAGLKSS